MEERPPPLSSDEKAEKSRAFKIGPILQLLAIIIISLTGWLCLSGTVDLAGKK